MAITEHYKESTGGFVEYNDNPEVNNNTSAIESVTWAQGAGDNYRNAIAGERKRIMAEILARPGINIDPRIDDSTVDAATRDQILKDYNLRNSVTCTSLKDALSQIPADAGIAQVMANDPNRKDAASHLTAWDEYLYRVRQETVAIQDQLNFDRKSELQALEYLLQLEHLGANPVNNQIHTAIASGDNNEMDRAAEGARRLLSLEGGEAKQASLDALSEMNKILQARKDVADNSSLNGSQKQQLHDKQYSAANTLQTLFDSVQTQFDLTPAQALIIVQLMLVKPGKDANGKNIEFIPGPEVLSEYENLNDPYRLAPLTQDQQTQLVNYRIEIEDLAKMLKSNPLITKLEDLGIALGTPQNNQNNQNQQQQNQNSLQALQANIDSIKNGINADPSKLDAHKRNTDEWSERQAGRGRVSTFSFMRKNTKKKLEGARDHWMISAREVITNLDTAFEGKRHDLEIAYTNKYDAQHALDPNNPPNNPDYLDDNAYNAAIANITQTIDADKAQLLENTRREMMEDATTRTQDKINENTEGKNIFTRKFLKLWGTLSGGSDSNKGMGKFFRKHKILGKFAKAGIISALALPFGLAAATITSGIGVGAGFAVGAGLLARGVARGIAGSKMDTATNKDIISDAMRRCTEIINQIRSNAQLDLDAFGGMTHDEVQRRLTENRLRMGKSVALGATIGVTLGTVGHVMTDWVPDINMPWANNAPAPASGNVPPTGGGGNLPPNTGIGGTFGVGNGMARSLIEQSYNIPAGGSIIHDVISHVSGVSDNHANDAYTWLANHHGGTAGLQRYIEANTFGANNVYNGGSGIGVGISEPGTLKLNAKLANEITKAIVATKS